MTQAALFRVQQLDERLSALREQQRHHEALLQRDPAVASGSTALDVAEREQADSEAGLATIERELSTVADRARALHRRLYGGSVRNPNELLEMQHELDGLTSRVKELEDRVVEAMESAERAASITDARRSDLEAAQRRRDEAAGPLRQRLQSLEEDIAADDTERQRLFDSLPSAERALYTRVAARHRPAVVSIAGDACGGCHLPLSMEERRAVRAAERVVQCSSCDRILVP
ncbi:MAG: hypothetical protein JOY68_08850 [Candidatus Dormibacteraeota bacterium]|nr:hypothetical protein [Candidatus Dormibacteraeota bacterium]